MPGSTEPGQHHRNLEVEPSDIADHRRVGRVEGSDGFHAGVVHEHIDRTDGRLDSFDQPVDLDGVEQVGDEGVAAQLGRQLIERGAVTRRNRHDCIAPCILARQSGSDPPRPSGDQHVRARELHRPTVVPGAG